MSINERLRNEYEENEFEIAEREDQNDDWWETANRG